MWFDTNGIEDYLRNILALHKSVIVVEKLDTLLTYFHHVGRAVFSTRAGSKSC